MRKYVFLLLSSILFAQAYGQQESPITTFILLRHAEKGNDGTADPDLTAEGIARASKIVSILKETKVDAIYSTNYKRTRNTVTPLALANGLELQLYEALKQTELEAIVQKYSGGTVVISGHSNNIPGIANLLVGKVDFKNFTDDDYNNLLIVSVVESGKIAKVTWLNY